MRRQLDHCGPGSLPAAIGGGRTSPGRSRHAAGSAFGGRVEAQFTLSASIDELFAALQSDGVEILQPPLDQPWGCRDFQVADPDGNKVWISQRLGAPEGIHPAAAS